MAGAFIGQALAYNETEQMGRKDIRYVIANQQDVPDIAITADGILYTPNGVDRELRQNYSVTVISDSSKGIIVSQVSFFIFRKYVGKLTSN